MKLTQLFAACAIAAGIATTSAQAAEFTEYLGKIPVSSGAAPVAAGPNGELFYGTLRAGTSTIRVIEDPEAEIGSTATDVGTTIATYALNATRGFQSLSVTSTGTLFAAADNGGTGLYTGSLFKFDPLTVGATTTYTEDLAFRTNLELNNPGRRSGVAVIGETGAGLIGASGFGASNSTLDYFDFAGNRVGTQLSEALRFYRELQYNLVDDIIYLLRAGSSNNDMLRAYVENVNPVTGGGDIVQSILIDDGANNPGTVEPIQNGFYYAAEHQLITCDQRATTGTPLNIYQVRVWDIIDNGTSLSLAYSVVHPIGSPLLVGHAIPFDATVIGDKLYVTRGSANGSGGASIYVYGVPPASVRKWNLY